METVPRKGWKEGEIMDEPRTPWRLTITHVENGYVIEDEVGETTVYEEDERCPTNSDPACFCRVLWHLTEYFGQTGSKWDKARISICVEEREIDDDNDDELGPNGGSFVQEEREKEKNT